MKLIFEFFITTYIFHKWDYLIFFEEIANNNFYNGFEN